MSLLPIIYTSLVLFFGLAMIVIIVSYIAYKLKAQKNPLIEEEQKKYIHSQIPERIVNIHNNLQNNFYNEVYKSNRKNNNDNYKSLQYQSYQKRKNDNEIKLNNNSKYPSNKLKNIKPRIQIMNSFSKFTSKNYQKVNYRGANVDISKVDLLKYYNDYNNDSKFDFIKIVPYTR
ncbi:MAG: hypothetical protein N2249_04460 [Melioribacter sp.]|nr:hypothetical protein [Melioribacter sp.]